MSSPAMARESCWILWPQANEEFVPIQARRKQNHCRTNRTGDKPAAAGTGKERELQSNAIGEDPRFSCRDAFLAADWVLRTAKHQSRPQFSFARCKTVRASLRAFSAPSRKT